MLWIIAIIGCIISLATSLLADHALVRRIPLIGSFAGLERSVNAGVAFSITFPPMLQFFLVVGALLFVLFFASRSPSTRLHQWAFGLIIGGAVANIIDRSIDGFVTDYFQVGAFPVFNVADSCITVGVGLLLLAACLNRNTV